MADAEEITAEVARDAEAAGFVGRLAETFGGTVRANAIFGEPVVRERVTVIPVAKASWGFGGGSGGDTAAQGTGGGGGGLVAPLGFIEVHDDGARFVPIHERQWTPMRVTAAAAALAAIASRRRRRR